MFDTQINTIEDLLSGIADCEYQTRAQVVGHIYKELERTKAIKAVLMAVDMNKHILLVMKYLKDPEISKSRRVRRKIR